MKLIIAGSRSCTDMNLLLEAIATLPEKGAEVTEVVCGMADGADTLGKEWAESKGIPVKEMPVTKRDWETYGKRAGMIRNREMALYCSSNDMLIPLWDGRSTGTGNMIDEAHMRKMAVLVCRFEPEERPSTDDDPKDEDKVGFGKHKDSKLGDVPSSYWWWMWDNILRDKANNHHMWRAKAYVVKHWGKLAKEHKGFRDEIPPNIK